MADSIASMLLNRVGDHHPVRRTRTKDWTWDQVVTDDRAFSGGAPPLYPIVQAPFHAAASGISDLGTKGGLRTDTAARVLDTSGAVIPGLYAAGNTMAAPSGTTYPGGGNPIGTSMVFSHVAVLDMVKEL